MIAPTVDGISVLVLVLLGFFVGILGGFFGVGGTWIVTPGLNLLGVPITYAVGTDLLHTMGKSIVATIKHRRFGNLDVRLGGLMVVGTAVGLDIGKEALLALERTGLADDVVRIAYVIILFSISIGIFVDHWKTAIRPRAAENERLKLYERVQRLRIPPYMDFPASDIRRLSVWVPLGVALVTGVMSGFLGVGAGFVRMPSLVYVVGVPTKLAIGTDLFEIIWSAGIGAFLYALAHRVLVAVAAVMLVGASIGAQLGTYATRYVKGHRLRLYFGLSVFFPAIALVMKEVSKRTGDVLLARLSIVVMFASALLIALVILRAMVRGILAERDGRDSETAAP